MLPHVHIYTNKLTQKHTHRHTLTDTQTDRQTDTHTQYNKKKQLTTSHDTWLQQISTATILLEFAKIIIHL